MHVRIYVYMYGVHKNSILYMYIYILTQIRRQIGLDGVDWIPLGDDEILYDMI